MQEHFRIYGNTDLEKSILNVKPTDNGGIHVEGRFMNTVRDMAGEMPIIQEMIWEPLKTGSIKYEHDPVKIMKSADGRAHAVTVPNPDNIIGVPLKVTVSPDGREAYIVGTLFPESATTQALVKKAKEFDAHNKRHPEAQRHFQWSVEGNYYKRTADGRYAGVVTNVVISPQAQDATTYVKFANEQNLALAKSLAAGCETNTTAMQGGDALRTESLEGADNSNQSSTNQRKKKMKKQFGNNKDEIFSHFMKEEGGDKDKAMAKTLAALKDMEDAQTQAEAQFNTDADAAVEKIQKSAASLTALVSTIEGYNTATVETDTELKKSIATLNSAKPEEFDATAFLSRTAEAVVLSATNNQAAMSEMAKSMATLADGLASAIALNKSLAAQIAETREMIADTNEVVRFTARGLKKSAAGIGTDVEGVEIEKPKADEPETLLKSVNPKAVQAYAFEQYEAQKETETGREFRRVAAEIGATNRIPEGMSKSVATAIAEHFKK